MDRKYPSLKGRHLKQLLARAGYSAERTRGSHWAQPNADGVRGSAERTRGSHMRMVAAGRPSFTLAYHDKADVSPSAVMAVLERQAKLSPDEIKALLAGERPEGMVSHVDSTIVIRRHDPSEGPGTLWWAESEAGFVGGHDNLNELTRSAAEWAEDAGIEPRFRLEMEAASSDSQAVVVAPRALSRAVSAHACEPASPPEQGMGHTQERGAASSQATGEMGRGEPATSAAVSGLRPYLVLA